ncbi:MAG: glycogen synthase, partial [Planctomycetota bacterium]
MAGNKRLRILHVASEAVPLAKSGGLADVVGSLPAALCDIGYDARIVLPGYRAAIEKAETSGRHRWLTQPLQIEAGGHTHEVHVCEWKLGKVRYYLIAANELYDRPGLYGPTAASPYEDNARRFAVLAKAALALPGLIGWVPHVIHAHDWQAGLVPVLRERGWNRSLPATRTVFTIHNLAYQGEMWHFDIKLAGLDWALFNPMQLEHHGRFNFLKSGVVFADRVTTVSQRYAEEIQGGEFGCGMDAVLRHHNYKLSGIRNGIDADEWNPATDKHIVASYSADDLTGKAACKQALRYELGLVENPCALVGVVSRLVHQKGLDLVLEAVEPYILAGRMQLAVLGSGEPALEQGFR